MSESGFWPTTLQDWTYIAIAIAAAVGAVWRFVRKPIMKEINAVGDRLNTEVGERVHLLGRVEASERAIELSRVDTANLRESVMRMAIEVQTVVKLAQDSAVERAEQLGEINARLERIETKVDERAERDREDRRNRIRE